MAEQDATHTSGDRRDGTPVSRRDLFVGGGGVLAGAAVAAGVTLAVTDGDGADTTGTDRADGTGTDGGSGDGGTVRLTSLTVEQGEALAAMLSRLVPSGDDGLGAAEARVVVFIDRALADEFRDQLPLYESNLEVLDDRARSDYEVDRFADLDGEQMDELIAALEEATSSGNPSDEGATSEVPVQFSGGFFDTLISHTRMGMFGDPVYGGNHDFVGWRLMGYAGPRMAVDETAQDLGGSSDAEPQSAYGHETVGLQITGGR